MQKSLKRHKTSTRGFTLAELLIAVALGVLVLGGASMLFKKGLDITVMVAQRAELQQNSRAGINAMVRDLTLAATDLPAGGIQLPQSAAPLAPRFGCIAGGTCYLTNGNNTFSGSHLYYVNPHDADGAPTGAVTPDSLVVAYADPKMVLGPVTFSPAGDLTGSQITAANPPATVNLSAQSNGITAGDLIWLSGSNGGNAIGVVTDFDGKNTISFASGDALNINQPPTQKGTTLSNNVSGNICSNLLFLNPPPNPPVMPSSIQAQRIFLITYFVSQDAQGRRKLMRQVNAHPATPVAENVENLQITYDTIDDSVTPPVPVINQSSPASSPNLIRKINIALTVRTTAKIGAYGDYQRLTLATSVNPRNMSTTAVF